MWNSHLIHELLESETSISVHQASGYLFDKMPPFRSACVSSRYYWYYARDICAHVIYRQYHASCIFEIPSFVVQMWNTVQIPTPCKQTLSILYTIHYVKLNRYNQSSHKVAVEITKFIRLMQLLLQFLWKEKLSFTDAHAHPHMKHSRKKLYRVLAGNNSRKESKCGLPYSFKTLKIVLYKSKSRLRSGNFYGRIIYDLVIL